MSSSPTAPNGHKPVTKEVSSIDPSTLKVPTTEAKPEDARNEVASDPKPMQLKSETKDLVTNGLDRPGDSVTVPSYLANPLPIPTDQFPHVDVSSNRVLTTIENLAFMIVFYGITVRYNVISKRVEIIIPGLKGSPDNIDNASNAIIMSLATLNHIGSGNIQYYLVAIANENSYNPIREWITSKPWDGTDRIVALTETLEIAEDYSIHLRDALVRRWLLSAGAAVLQPGFHSRGVLTLQGPQSIGKTAWVCALLPPGLLRDSYIKLDHHLDPGNKDSLLVAVSHWLVEIGELDSSFKKDIARLKGFITATSDKVRVPYARRASEYPRRTVFVATVNTDQFLVDETGNTRWWTVAVKSINYQHTIDMQQLWAQVAHLLEHDKEQWWLDEHEEPLLNSYNRQFMRSSVVADLLDSNLDWDEHKNSYKPKSATDVLKMIGIDRPTNQQARDCGAELRTRLGPPKKSQGKTRWHVPPALRISSNEDW